MAGFLYHRHTQRLQWSLRKGADMLKDEPMSGYGFIFRGRSGSQIKLLWSIGDGLCLLTKWLERDRFA